MYSYMCTYYDIKKGMWCHSKRVTKKEAEFLMKELANSGDKEISQISVVKIVIEVEG